MPLAMFCILMTITSDSMIMMTLAGWNLYDRNELVDLIEETLRRETSHNCLRPHHWAMSVRYCHLGAGEGGTDGSDRSLPPPVESRVQQQRLICSSELQILSSVTLKSHVITYDCHELFAMSLFWQEFTSLAGQIRGQVSVCRAWNALPNKEHKVEAIMDITSTGR